MRKLLLAILVGTVGLARAAEPASAPQAGPQPKTAAADARPRKDHKGAKKGHAKPAAKGAAAPAKDSPPEPAKPCEPVKPCPIDG